MLALSFILSSNFAWSAPLRRARPPVKKNPAPVIPANLVTKKMVYQDAEARAIAKLLGINTAVASEKKFALVKAPVQKTMPKRKAAPLPVETAPNEDYSKYIILRFSPSEETTTLEMEGRWGLVSGRPGYVYTSPFIEDGELAGDDLSSLIRKVMPELIKQESSSTKQIGASMFEHTVGSNFILTVQRMKTGARKSKGQWGYQVIMKADQG